MQSFEDEAIILNARLHAETGAIVHCLSRDHGMIAAYVAGAQSRRTKAWLQPGQEVHLHYQARPGDRLGLARIEGVGTTISQLLDYPKALLALQSATHLTDILLSEGDVQPGVYLALKTLISVLEHEAIWPLIYIRFEAGLLEAAGFGLHLGACAVTGEVDDLIYVSPKSGRAVSAKAGHDYRDKLLALPAFLLSSQAGFSDSDIAQGFELTGYFLQKHIFHPMNKPLPEIRQRLMESLLPRPA